MTETESPLTDEHIAAARTVLLDRLSELRARAAHIHADLAEPMAADSGEQAVEVEDDEALAGQEALVAQEIAAVRRALTRIAAGAYGNCRRCGRPIAAERIAVQPEADLCMDCARSWRR